MMSSEGGAYREGGVSIGQLLELRCCNLLMLICCGHKEVTQVKMFQFLKVFLVMSMAVNPGLN